MLFRKTPDEMTDQELIEASFAVENLIESRLTLRNNPKYKAKFKNQPPPEVNPSLVELRKNIKDEFERRKVNTNE